MTRVPFPRDPDPRDDDGDWESDLEAEFFGDDALIGAGDPDDDDAGGPGPGVPFQGGGAVEPGLDASPEERPAPPEALEAEDASLPAVLPLPQAATLVPPLEPEPAAPPASSQPPAPAKEPEPARLPPVPQRDELFDPGPQLPRWSEPGALPRREEAASAARATEDDVIVVVPRWVWPTVAMCALLAVAGTSFAIGAWVATSTTSAAPVVEARELGGMEPPAAAVETPAPPEAPTPPPASEAPAPAPAAPAAVPDPAPAPVAKPAASKPRPRVTPSPRPAPTRSTPAATPVEPPPPPAQADTGADDAPAPAPASSRPVSASELPRATPVRDLAPGSPL